MSTSNSITLFDFNASSDISSWRVVDDVVMGGRSSGQFGLDEEGNGIFSGEVSLENNGGFSSVRYLFDSKNIEGARKAVVRLKGDGKKYQFRIKAKARDYHSYIVDFTTSGEWETIEVLLTDMYPAFRGRKLSMPNFEADEIEEIRFLIGNKKPQSFKLLIDEIRLE